MPPTAPLLAQTGREIVDAVLAKRGAVRSVQTHGGRSNVRGRRGPEAISHRLSDGDRQLGGHKMTQAMGILRDYVNII